MPTIKGAALLVLAAAGNLAAALFVLWYFTSPLVGNSPEPQLPPIRHMDPVMGGHVLVGPDGAAEAESEGAR